MEITAFVVLSVLAILSGIVVITHRNPLISALALAFNLVAIAGFYFLLGAQFLALLQVIVYAGAIMVLILFVIMLLNLSDITEQEGSGFIQKWGAIALTVTLALLLGWRAAASVGEGLAPQPEGFGTVASVGVELFSRFFYPFEVISLLLVVAMIGALLLAKRRI
jgi:NADH-quinone oxidoreductase subunit J